MYRNKAFRKPISTLYKGILEDELDFFTLVNIPQRPFCTSSGWGVNRQVGECLVELCHQGGRPLDKEPPRVLREVERLTRNPQTLANADGRCWNDTLRRKRSFKTHRPPYPTRRILVTARQETKKLLHDESGRTMSGRT